MKRITNEEEIFFVVELNLFTIRTITLSESKKINYVISNAKVNIEDLMFNFPHSKRQIQVDSTPTCIKVQDLDITC